MHVSVCLFVYLFDRSSFVTIQVILCIVCLISFRYGLLFVFDIDCLLC